jgi:hypothetical protein
MRQGLPLSQDADPAAVRHFFNVFWRLAHMQYRALKLRDERFLLGVMLIVSLTGAAYVVGVSAYRFATDASPHRYLGLIALLFYMPVGLWIAIPRNDTALALKPKFEKWFANGVVRIACAFLCAWPIDRADTPDLFKFICAIPATWFFIGALWRILAVNGILLILSPSLIPRAIALVRFPFSSYPMDAILRRAIVENRDLLPVERLAWEHYLAQVVLDSGTGPFACEIGINRRIQLAAHTVRLRREAGVTDLWIKRMEQARIDRQIAESEARWQKSAERLRNMHLFLSNPLARPDGTLFIPLTSREGDES